MYPLGSAMYPLPIDCIEKSKKKKIKTKKDKKSKISQCSIKLSVFGLGPKG